MSFDSYRDANNIISANKDLADFIGGRPVQLIKDAEDRLGFKFNGLYLDYLKTFGAGNFGAQEIYGIINNDFKNSSVPDAIWFTLSERREINLPNNLLIIYDTGGDELFCLDFNKQDDTTEPKVISFIPGMELKSQKYEVIAEDFGDFLLELVKQEV